MANGKSGQSILELLPQEFIASLTPEALEILKTVYTSVDPSASLGAYDAKTNRILLNDKTTMENLQHEAVHALNLNAGPLGTSGSTAQILQAVFGSPISNELDPSLSPLNLPTQAQTDIRDYYGGGNAERFQLQGSSDVVDTLKDTFRYAANRPSEEYATRFQQAGFDTANLPPELASEYSQFFNPRAPGPTPINEIRRTQFDPEKGFRSLNTPIEFAPAYTAPNRFAASLAQVARDEGRRQQPIGPSVRDRVQRIRKLRASNKPSFKSAAQGGRKDRLFRN